MPRSGWVLAVALLDQATKAVAIRFLAMGAPVAIVPGIFKLTLVHNTGAAFGLFKDGSLFLAAFSIASIIFLPFWARRLALPQKSMGIALAWIVGGAIGNLADRLRFGYVVDFLDFRVWPVFNVADSAIVLGALWIAVLVWRSSGRSKEA